MAEVLGIVTGVFQLIPLCSSGFIFIKDVVQAKQKLSEQLIRIQNHHDNFHSWHEIWGPSETRERKFKHYAQERPLSAKAVLRQLALYSRLFYDLKALERYGFKIDVGPPKNDHIQLVDDFHFETNADLSPHNIRRFEAKCNSNLALIKKIKFVLGKRDKDVDELIIRLQEYNEVLWRYGPPLEVARLDKGIYDNIGQVVADQLKLFLGACAREAESATDPRSAAKYRALAKMANFRSQVQEASGHPQIFGASSFRMADNYNVDSRGMSTMALLYDYPQKGDHRVVLIEWIQNPQLSGRKRDTERLSLLLNVPKPDEMFVLDSYGILDDLQRTKRLGLVLKPPVNVRANLPQPLPPGAISERRMPISLRQLMKTRDSLDLGARFDIAKKLVDTVHMIHAVDWVHKNIRASSVLFFPLGEIDDTSSNRPSYTVYDFSRPFITGFSNARSDDIPSGNDDFYDRSQTKEAHNLTLDYYQHPAKLNDPHVAYRRLFDLYSLGCVLLELALWTTVDKLIGRNHASKETPYKFIRALSLETRLDRMVGKIFADVIRDCIALGEKNALDNPARFGTDIASRLAQCVA
ncbi:hypothetical protein QBC40DRAFT_13349 [Triangularia verruculosa]|uniref:Protein kinase domain-containing protein n=1 Tax=Triangularia verruculosa TaxID=2587418 RepID=A0AAN6X9A3_9PEZI|nr:hypothetical protein QBC40DRAFT_13349 [Triangularia verruculosa]